MYYAFLFTNAIDKMAQKIKWLISACENKLSRTNDNVKNRKEDRTGEEELRINGIKRKEGRKEGRKRGSL